MQVNRNYSMPDKGRKKTARMRANSQGKRTATTLTCSALPVTRSHSLSLAVTCSPLPLTRSHSLSLALRYLVPPPFCMMSRLRQNCCSKDAFNQQEMMRGEGNVRKDVGWGRGGRIITDPTCVRVIELFYLLSCKILYP